MEGKVKITDNISERIAKLEADKLAYSKKIADYSQAVKDSYMDKVKGVITEQQFVEFSRGFAEDKSRLGYLMRELDVEIAALERKRTNAKTKGEIVDDYTEVQQLARVMVEKLIGHIRVGKRDKETRKVPVEIHWAFEI